MKTICKDYSYLKKCGSEGELRNGELMEKMCTREGLVKLGDLGTCLQCDENDPSETEMDDAEERKVLGKARGDETQRQWGGAGL